MDGGALPTWFRGRATDADPGWQEQSLTDAVDRLVDRSRLFVEALAEQYSAGGREVRFVYPSWLRGDLVLLIDGVVFIQLDELIEVVVVGDATDQREFGDWTPANDRFADAAAYAADLLVLRT